MGYSFVIVSSRFNNTLATSVYDASCVGLAPFGRSAGAWPLFPVTTSQGLSHPSEGLCP